MNAIGIRYLGAWSMTALLAACGGGGGDSASVPVVAVASPLAGGWEGTSSSGDGLQAMILEDGRMWVVDGTQVSGTLFVSGLTRGTLTTSGTAVSAADLRMHDLGTGAVAAGTLSGTFTAGTRITATVTSGGASATVQLAPAAATTYNYDSAATLAAVAGNWPGFFSNDTGTVVVAANGGFTSTTASGCKVSGTVLPRASGKNVYDVTVSFGTAACNVPVGTTAAGNAIITNLTGGARQLAIAVATSDGANAGVFFGQR